MRTLTAPAIAAIAAGTVVPALLVEMDLDSGPLYLNHSRLTLVINGVTYGGTHGLGKVAEMSNQGAELPKLTFSLAGSPSDKIALALSEPVQGRPCRVKLALFDNASGTVLDVSKRFAGWLNVMGIADGVEQSVVTVTAEAGVRDLLRASNLLYSNAHQQALVPGDMFFQYTDGQVEQHIVFPARHWFLAHKE